MILKECKYIKKKIIRHIIDDFESSSGDSDDSGDPDHGWIKAMKLIFLEKTILKINFSEMYFLREKFSKCF